MSNTKAKPVVKVDLNFKVEPDFHRAFKTAAAARGLEMRDLLKASFLAWLEKDGDKALRAALPKF